MLKKFLCAGLIICILFSLCACEKSSVPDNNFVSDNNSVPDNDNKSESVEAPAFITVMIGGGEIEEWNENNVICNVSWDKLKLSEEDEAKFPGLKKTFDKLNDDAMKDAKSRMYELTRASEDLYGDEYNPFYFKGESNIFIQRADTRIVSYLKENVISSGEANSEDTYESDNFNPETGEAIKLSDVITGTRELAYAVEKALTVKYDFLDEGLSETLSGYSYDDYIWTLDYQGITFWFNPFEIAAGRHGLLSAKLYFDEESNIVRKEYMLAPCETYAVALPFGRAIDFDLNVNDEKKDSVLADKVPDMYGSYYKFTTTVNGETYTDEIAYGYDFITYLVHTGRGSYIYSELYSDNNYHSISVIDLSDEKPEKILDLGATSFYREYVEEGADDGTVYRTMINDVRSFTLQTRFDILGTRMGTAVYKANEITGIPEMTDEAYTFTDGHPVTLKIPLMAEILPSMDTEELGEGMYLVPYQTDGKTYIDLTTENSWVIRFKIDISGWPRTVNGIPEDECFEELFYAG